MPLVLLNPAGVSQPAGSAPASDASHDSAMSMLIAAIHILRRESCNLSGSAKVLGSGSNSTGRVSCDL